MKRIGIDAISYYVPSIYLSIEELSKNRNLNYEKLNKGLGLEKMAIAIESVFVKLDLSSSNSSPFFKFNMAIWWKIMSW